jgi:SAM-dependent methyltransferase
MASLERKIYRNYASFALNQILLPAKLVVPQPIVAKVPGLTTNKEIRTNIVLSAVRGRLLDVGCGPNLLVQRYRQNGGDATGVDVYPWPGVDLQVNDSAELPFPDQSFDTVTFVACINHIPNRGAALKEAKRLLKPQGIVLATNLTPTLSRIWHRWAFWDADQHERGMAPGEVYGLTHRELLNLAEGSGLRFVRRDSFSWGLNNLYTFD